MCLVKANATFHGHKLTDIPVLNPGDWFGKCFLLEIGGSYSPLFLVVEADSVQDAIAELAENTTFGHHVVVLDEDLVDYDPAREARFVLFLAAISAAKVFPKTA